MEKPENNPIRAARMARGWSLRELARRADLSPPTIIGQEYGRRTPDRRTRRSLSVALGVPASALWPDDRERDAA